MMKTSVACLVAILISLPVVTTGSNYRLAASPVAAATVSVGDLAVGSVISVGGQTYVKINSSNVLAATSSFTCPDGQWVAGQYVKCFDDEHTILDVVNFYGCSQPTGLLQTWDGCGDLATPAALDYTPGPCLIDARDWKTYEVRKFADGQCWMVDNLAYGGDTALGEADGCVKTTFMGSGADCNTGKDVYNDADGSYKTARCVSFTNQAGTTVNNQATPFTNRFGEATYGECRYPFNDLASKDGITGQGEAHGYLYDWTAATQDPYTYARNNYNPEDYTSDGYVQGLCPTGWRLPKAGGGDFATLHEANGSPTTGFWQAGGAWKTPIYSLFLGEGNLNGEATIGQYHQLTGSSYLWTSTYWDTVRAYYVEISATSVDPEHRSYQNYGMAIRCVKR